MTVGVVYSGVPLCLVVDDEPAIRLYVTTILRGEDFQTLEAEDGARALEIVEELAGGVDLIISDVHMPNGDGFTLAHTIKNSFPAVSVILISGHGTPDSGFEILTKPFSPGALLQAVRTVLARMAPD